MKPFQYMKLSVRFKGLDTPVYPYFLGSFIRGNFGLYLKKVICPFRIRKECDGCLIRARCFYGEIFESQVEKSQSGKDIPHPFVLDIKEEQYRDEETCSDLSFDMVLFGPALNNVEFFILVFSLMAREGIGKSRIKSKEVIVRDHNGEMVYTSKEQKILKMPQVLSFEFGNRAGTRKVRIAYCSPVRLKREKKWVDVPDFEVLIRGALRRVMYLKGVYGESEVIHTGEIIQSAGNVRTSFEELELVDRYRYSNRKNVRMNFGGIIGKQEFEGDILPVHIDLLEFVSVFHIGKSSSFGAGKVGIEI